MSAPDEIFETKLTRTEVLDLILDDLIEEVNAQILPLAKREQALEKIEPKLADFLHTIPATAKVEASSPGRWDEDKRCRVTISFRLKPSELPKPWADRCSELAEVEKDLRSLRDQRTKLTENRRRALNEIIRRSLESSPGGRRVLDTVAAFKLSVHKRLLGEGKP